MPESLDIAEKRDEVITSAIRHIGAFFSNENTRYAPGFLNGEAGIILFLYYYCRYYCGSDYRVAESRLSNLLMTLEEGCLTDSTFAEGIIGVLLVLSHLCRRGFVSDLDYLPKEIEDCVYQYTRDCLNRGVDELFYGAGGGLFLLMHEWESSHKPSIYKKLVNLSDGIFSRRNNSPDKLFSRPLDTGIAHGYGAWLIILSRLINLGICPKKNQETLHALKREYEGFLCTENKEVFFPRTILDKGEYVFWKRFGWCTGDLSCLVSLLQCYQNQKDEVFLTTVVMMLKKLAQRLDPFSYKVHDAALCHGASGLHLLFYWMNQLYPCKEFYVASRYWLNVCLINIDFSDELVGFRKRYYDANKALVASRETSFLEGIAGIGLTFISAQTGDYRWKELILLSNERFGSD